MSSEIYLILAVLISGFAIIIWFIQSKLSQNTNTTQEQTLMEWLKTTQSDMGKLQSALTNTLQQSDKNMTDTLLKSYQEMNTRLENATKVIGELKQETGKFSEIGRSMKDLQDFLNSPKLRGNLGEKVLKDMLTQMFPKSHFQTQYRFKSGDIVDVVIKTQAGLIPIDAKFPMENFTKMNKAESSQEKLSFQKLFIIDVKKHLKAIATKYLKMSEGTVDFAMMYIPSESVYYQITADTPELSDYAQSLRVLPVSPATCYAFLRTILVSFEGARIASEAQNLLNNLRDIQKSSHEFGLHLDLLGKHITNAYKNMGDVTTEFSALESKIDTTKTIGSGLADDKVLKIEN